MQVNSKPAPRPLAGIVLVDKPQGYTSNQILQKTKRLYQARKAGHTGTLDPLATGMLPICFGAATRVSGMMLASSKRYRVTAVLGVATDTGDATGATIEVRDRPTVTIDALEAAVRSMIGPGQQIPPMYSAVRHEGRRLYQLAREGKAVPRKPRAIAIHDLHIDGFDWPRLELTVHCSKGTYVRTLVTDLALGLGTVAHVTALRRLTVGPFTEPARMVTLETLEDAAREGLESLDRWLLGIDSALSDWPAIDVTEAQGTALRHGRSIEIAGAAAADEIRIYGPGGDFVGTGQVSGRGVVKPTRIFRC